MPMITPRTPEPTRTTSGEGPQWGGSATLPSFGAPLKPRKPVTEDLVVAAEARADDELDIDVDDEASADFGPEPTAFGGHVPVPELLAAPASTRAPLARAATPVPPPPLSSDVRHPAPLSSAAAAPSLRSPLLPPRAPLSRAATPPPFFGPEPARLDPAASLAAPVPFAETPSFEAPPPFEAEVTRYAATPFSVDAPEPPKAAPVRLESRTGDAPLARIGLLTVARVIGTPVPPEDELARASEPAEAVDAIESVALVADTVPPQPHEAAPHEAAPHEPPVADRRVSSAPPPGGAPDPDLVDPSDVVDLETFDLAFLSVFAPPAPPSPPAGNVVLSATTGDLVFAPPATAAALKTDQPLAPPPLPKLVAQAPLARRHAQLPPKGDVVLGIDLGTTYTCAAVVEAKHASVLASRWGTPTIPSVVAFLPDGKTLVGEAALRHGNDPRRVIAGSKRIFGRAFHSPIVQEAKDHFAYEIVEGNGGDAAIRVDGRVIELEDVAAAILREVRESAALQLEGRVNRAVITCPAHFNERQRESIRVAGELAGFHVERVLSEPTAAALHFGLGRGMQKRKVLVYDLGGGTFDVSLLEVDGDVFEVLGTGGDTFLGGIDFDACIADLIVEAFLEKEQIDARSDPVAIARVLEFAERAKRELTERSNTIVQIDHLTVQPHAARSITVPIRRARVEELWTPLVEHTASIVEQMLERVQVAPSEIHEVLLVGGQSRTPLVQKRMEALFGRKLTRDVNPDEAIAQGAAQLGDSLARSSNVTLIDVLPMSIGVGLPGGRYKRILERETKLPAERSYSLKSTRDDQTRFEVMLFQGEDESVENDEPLGVVELNDLPKGPRGSVTVIVTLRVTSQQVLEIEARETRTGKGVKAKLATKHTAETIRRKLGLPATPSKDANKSKRLQRRGTGVWGWLSGLFKRR